MGIVADYETGLFVIREDALRWALARMRRWEETQPAGSARDKVWRPRHRSSQAAPGDQVVALVGERGVGKTWFLRYLEEMDSRWATVSVYLDLEERSRFSKPEYYVEFVDNQIRARTGETSAILLMDTVPPYLDEHLRALERRILAPHLAQRGSLVIMALVHPSRVCWRTPSLRGGDHYLLLPFKEPQTREQLRLLRKSGLLKNGVKVADVQRHSGGLPLLNHLLATQGKAEAFDRLLEYWFSRIPGDERDTVRRYLEAVCVLDVLEHASIQAVLGEYNRHRPEAGQAAAHAGDVRNMLRKHWLARSVPDCPGRIVVVESVRRAAREVLKAHDPELYAGLERVAEAPSRGER